MKQEDVAGHAALNAIISPEGDGYVALCPELNISAYASTPSSAINRLSDRVFYFARLQGESDEFLSLTNAPKELRQCILSIHNMGSRKVVRDLLVKKVLTDDLHIDMVRCSDCYVALCPELNIAERSVDRGSALNSLVEHVTAHMKSI